MCRRKLIGLLGVAACWISLAGAQERSSPVVEITYEEALVLAREQAPSLAASEARVAEAESRVVAASVWPFNPELSAAAGPRDAPGETVVDWSVGLEQRIELGGQRGLRRDAARIGVEAASARSADAQRHIVREVSHAFVSALYWKRRVLVAEENARLAQGVARIARQRHELGDVGGLDESVSELAVLRARTRIAQNEAALVRTKGRLKALLGIDAAAALSCRGDLRGLGIPDPTAAAPSERPDLRALRADVRQAATEAALGRAKRVPDLAVGAIFSREESVDVVKGALTIALPLFDRGQGETALAEARQQRLRAELDAASRAASVEVGSAREVLRRLTEAALRFEERGLSALERAETLARGSYEAGAIPLGELLAVRRELVQVRQDYADLLYRVATARVDLAASTGALR